MEAEAEDILFQDRIGFLGEVVGELKPLEGVLKRALNLAQFGNLLGEVDVLRLLFKLSMKAT